jgi:hypothetical protein
MGAPLGNQNAAKAKRWEAAIERALERRANGKPLPDDVSDLIRGIDAAADEFVGQMFATKDLGYFKEFGDRLDGKAKQQTEVSGPDGAPIPMKTVVNFVSGGS